MTDTVVVATPAAAIGFRLGGARVISAVNAAETVAAVRSASDDGSAAVIAIHGTLWSLLPSPIRDTWTTQSSPLIISLPDEDGDAAAARDAALRELLARAIGYQITFTSGAGTP